MDSFELNKIIGAVLGTLLFVMGVGFVAEAIYAPIQHRGAGYALAEPEAGGAVVAEPEEEAVPLAVLLASASVEQGANAVRKCQSCHNFGEGEPNKTGPGLYGVVGNTIASHEGFNYSADLAAKGAAGEAWTYENLDTFLTAPKGFAPGTKMAFAGVKNAAERANILAYLQTLDASPLPFPVAEAAPAEEAAPAAEEAAPVEEAAPAVEETAPAAAEPAATEAAPTTEAPAAGTPAEAPAQ